MSLRNISFSNEDTNHLQYTSLTNAWFINGNYNATNTGQSGTLSSTHDNSANVTFKFPQAATAVYYYGIRRCCGGFYAVCIDCKPTAPFTNDPITGFQTIDALNASDNGHNPPVVLWSQTFPSPAVHTVVLTNQFDDRFQNGNSEITVASFVLQVQDDSSPTSPAGVTSTSPPSPEQTSTSSSPSSGIPLKPLLGGLLGGMAVLALLILAISIRYRRRRRKNHMKTLGGASGGIPSSVTLTAPFTARESSSNSYVPTSFETARRSVPGADDAGMKWPTEQPMSEHTLDVNLFEASSDSGTLLPPPYEELSFENV
ncbi:hypothetical protein GYMLUDRAFT_43874 [Collybiopsis luxurians FD-317 M1]|uniref:Uncharacterized protein n=1 Tax=Collybiopsis luxurians FD-317 M1 TaxID=944289 RepID=A0A0D0CN51_9AGAR|nr:hypothetical protein GYMLUDRAFT_43874 [Collybiopsis luxurians FD-317 M1]